MATDRVRADNQERQDNEIDLLQSMYPGEVTVSKHPLADGDAELVVAVDGQHSLLFTLSALSYPSSAPPHVFLSCANDVPNSDRKALRRTLNAIVDRQQPDIECIDLIVADFKSALTSHLLNADQKQQQHDASGNPSDAEAGETCTQGLRVILWMHHLLATGKRKAIVQMSKELDLAGYSKPGYPGAVYVEGKADDVTAFVNELKSMRWQAIQERVTDHVPFADLTLAAMYSLGIHEVQSLGEITDALRASGDSGPAIAELFLEGMKIK